MHQFILQNWQTEQGLPQNSVLAIAQTGDGYLWLGTEEGLARYDGVRFVTFDTENSGLKDNVIRALLVNREGELLVGTQSGLQSFSHGVFRPFSAQIKLPDLAIATLSQDHAGNLWAGTDNSGLLRVTPSGESRLFTTSDGLPENGVLSMSEGRDGSLWIVTHRGLSRFAGGHFFPFGHREGLASNDVRRVLADKRGDVWVGTTTGLSRIRAGIVTNYTTSDGLKANDITALGEDRAHSIWVGTGQSGLTRFADGQFSAPLTASELAKTDIGNFFEDRQGDLWIGTGSHGVSCLKQGTFTTLTGAEGLVSDMILPVFEDSESNLWIGSERGLMKRSGGSISLLTVDEGLPDNLIFSVAQDASGAIWVGTRRGLARIKDGAIRTFREKEGLPSAFITCIFADRRGKIWIGTRSGISRYDGNSFQTFTTKNGLSDNLVRCIQEDRAGHLWVGTGSGLNQLRDGRFVSVESGTSPSGTSVFAIYSDPENTLWLATAKGLERFRDGHMTDFSRSQRVFGEQVSGVVEDQFGFLWLSSNHGITKVAKKALNQYADGGSQSLSPMSFDTTDGLKSRECNGGFQPAAWAARDGKLYFPTAGGLAFTEANEQKGKRNGGAVLLEHLTINDREFSPNQPATVNPGTGKLEIEFSAPDLHFQNKNQFRYMLEGFDKDWVIADTRRTAYYTNIPHGEYRFKVEAGWNGEWTSSAASGLITLKPHFYQTSLFFTLVGLFIISIYGAAYQIRMSQARARERKLRALVDEQTSALRESEHQLRRSRDQLEVRVQERTTELTKANHSLEDEITTRRQTEELLILAKEAAESANRAKSDFLANMSHELRTPINGILGMTEMAMSTQLDEEQTEYLEIAKFSADSLLAIVNDILDFSKIEARKLSLDLTAFDLHKMVSEVSRLFQLRAAQKNLDFAFQISAEVPREVTADALRIRQVLLNLLDNALKFTKQGQISLALASDQWVGESVKIHFTVQDSGIGIPEDKKRAIFEAFSQADNSSTRRYGGTGLGLTISRQLSEMMGGSLMVESELGVGSIFHFTAEVRSSQSEEQLATGNRSSLLTV